MVRNENDENTRNLKQSSTPHDSNTDKEEYFLLFGGNLLFVTNILHTVK